MPLRLLGFVLSEQVENPRCIEEVLNVMTKVGM
jgi:hypothetical protein